MANQPIQVIPGIPLIDSKEKDEALKPGQFGQYYDEEKKIRVFKQGEDGPYASNWGTVEELINDLIGGVGPEVLGTLDYIAAKAVPGGTDPSLKQSIAETRSDKELWRQANPKTATAMQLIGSVGPAKAAKVVGAGIRKIPKVGGAVGSIPRYLRNIIGTGATVGAITAAEAEPGARLSEFRVGAERGALTAGVLYPIFAAVSLLSALRGRVKPKWGAQNLINLAFSRHDLASQAETATEQELAAMSRGLRELSPGYREVAKKFMELGPNAALVDAFPDGPRALLRSITKQAGANRDLLQKIIENRGLSETERLVAIINKNVSNLTGDGASLAKALSEAAKPYYEEAFGFKYERSGIDDMDGSVPATEAQLEAASERDFTQAPDYNTDLMNADIAQVLGSRSGEAAFKEALDSFRDEYFYSQYSVEEADLERKRILQNAEYQGGVLKRVSSQARGFSLEFLDRVKRKLGSRAEKADQAGDSDTARIVGNLERKLRDALDDLDESPNKSYKVARETAKSRFDLEKSYDLGKNFRQVDADVIKKQLAEMSEGERQLFRAGAARVLRNLVEGVSETGQATPRIAEKTRSLNQILAMLPKKEAQQLRGDLARELTFAKTQKGTLGSGAGQFGNQDDSLEAIKNLSLLGASRVPGSNMLLFAGMVRRGVVRLLSGGVSDEEVVKMLLTQDQNEMQNILKALSAIPNDPNATRLRDYIVQAAAQQTRTVGEDRVQVPVQPGQYQMLRQPRSPVLPTLGGVLSGAYKEIKNAF
jgi:hypothetical protein